jgi:serine phosphatase RsbU (regulator of sigma subunit)
MTPPHSGRAEPGTPAPARRLRSEVSAARRQLDRYVWALLVFWMAVVGGSLAWNVVEVDRETRRLVQLGVQFARGEVGTTRGASATRFAEDPVWALARRHRGTLLLWHGLIFLVGALGLVVGGRRLRVRRDAIDVRNVQLAERGREVREAYGLLDRELKVVAEVQVGLLPARVPDIPGFEIATHYRPAARAGGDYFDFFALPEGRWGVLIADVSGHGAPAAVVMAMMRVVLHTLGRMSPPDQVLADVNAVLCRNILSGHFVTCCYGVLDPSTGTFAFASAGHPAPLCVDRESSRARQCAVEAGLPLGVDPQAQYVATTVRFPPVNMLALYTDGITEAVNTNGEQFGLSRLAAAVEVQAAQGVADVRDAVLAAVEAHRGAIELADDTALVLLRARP